MKAKETAESNSSDLVLLLIHLIVMLGEVELCGKVSRGLRRDLVGHLKETAREGEPRLSPREPRRDQKAAYQDWRSHEEIVGGEVQQVEAGGGVEVCVAHQLAGKQRLPGAAAQEAAHLTVGHVHPVGQHLHTSTKKGRHHQRRPKTRRLPTEELTFILSWTRPMSTEFIFLLPRCLQATEVMVSLCQSGNAQDGLKTPELTCAGRLWRRRDVSAPQIDLQTPTVSESAGGVRRGPSGPTPPHFASAPTLAALWWAPGPPGTSSSPDASSIWGCRRRCGLPRRGCPSPWCPAGRRWCLKSLFRQPKSSWDMLLQHQNNLNVSFCATKGWKELKADLRSRRFRSGGRPCTFRCEASPCPASKTHQPSALGHAVPRTSCVKGACLTVSTCLSTVPSAKNCGFLVSTTIRSKKERQDPFWRGTRTETNAEFLWDGRKTERFSPCCFPAGVSWWPAGGGKNRS